MTDNTINAMLKIHSAALVNMSMDGIISHLETLKGKEEPSDDYSRGYRDAVDLVIIQVRQIKVNFNNLGKPKDDE
jgi:hypothetical protein